MPQTTNEVENVILVDENDQEIGVMEKLQAHREGRLHRAFSVFIFNGNGKMLLQKRADNKYHSPGLWSNACCSHPRPGEDILAAANRRLQEEMGFSCRLNPAFKFSYRIALDQGMIENEFDHVFTGRFNDDPEINLDEVSDWKWMDTGLLYEDLKKNPAHYTYWFKAAFPVWLRLM
ncbi:isopentenyl-diphosphate Delta-isomerase [Pedobacter sp. SYP-B3415]|uniref:isopentenyl-diphosphate Delta-isomerase n=1 Tax=Pedobacter sp. SYP-B3415 TaxID=2496641 RepID=UPI00101E032A|nr:isopentenyl-diphosphate Delta-isomerase [Pedobacter sp. SYP-B3415]